MDLSQGRTFPVAHFSHDARNHIRVLALEYLYTLVSLWAGLLDLVKILELLIRLGRIEEALEGLAQAVNATQLFEHLRLVMVGLAAHRGRLARHVGHWRSNHGVAREHN